MPPKSIASVLLPLMLVAASGCSKITSIGPHGRHAYTQPHVLRLTMNGDVAGLDSFVHINYPEQYLTSLFAAHLVTTDARGDATVPELATVIPTQRNGGIARDGKTITWHLRRGVRWSDGAPFTADDVVFSTRQVLNPANDIVTGRDGWNLITKIEEPDKFTVVYHLKAPYALYALTFFSTGSATQAIVPEHLLAGYKNLNDVPYNAMPVGIGPFKVQSWKRGDSVTFVRNTQYWRGVPKLEKIIYKVIPNRNGALTALRAHEIDLWPILSPHYYSDAKHIPGIATYNEPGLAYDHLDFNVRGPILRDVRVRRALRSAFDRRAVVHKVDGDVNVLAEAFIPTSSRFFVAAPLVPFDLGKANALLDEAGWKRGADGVRVKDGRRLSLRFAALAGAADRDIAIELIRASWQKIGVEIVVRHYASALLRGPAAQGGIIRSGNYDVWTGEWALEPIPDVSWGYGCDSMPPAGDNNLFWCDRAASARMDRLKRTYDFSEQKAASDAVVRAVIDQVPTIVIDLQRNLAVFNSDLRGFTPNPVSPLDSMMDVDI